MIRLLRSLHWLLKGLVFFTLFAFSLNNLHDTRVHFFFGTWWAAPTVLVVLVSFALGMGVGVLGMLPRWWRERQLARAPQTAQTPHTPLATHAPLAPQSTATPSTTAPPAGAATPAATPTATQQERPRGA